MYLYLCGVKLFEFITKKKKKINPPESNKTSEFPLLHGLSSVITATSHSLQGCSAVSTAPMVRCSCTCSNLSGEKDNTISLRASRIDNNTSYLK